MRIKNAFKVHSKAQNEDADTLKHEISVDAKNILEPAIQKSLKTLLSQQNANGSWDFDMEDGILLQAHYIIYRYFIVETVKTERLKRIGNYIRNRQLSSGGWASYPNGPFYLDLSVTAYLALKILGDSEHSEHMKRASKAILENGGLESCAMLTRTQLAVYGVLPLSAIMNIPVEFVLFPGWFPFHIFNITSYIRIILTPILVILTIHRSKDQTPCPKVEELFTGNPNKVRRVSRANGQSLTGYLFFTILDWLIWIIKPLIPACIQKRALDKAVNYTLDRTSETSGFGGCCIAITYADMMFKVLGYPNDHPIRLINRRSIEKCMVDNEDESYVVQARTPIWDTILSVHALFETGNARALDAATFGVQFLKIHQVLDVRGDWAFNRPNLRPGGWNFFQNTPYYPDTDDTAIAVMAMIKVPGDLGLAEHISRGIEWIEGMECKGGGWAAFEADCTSNNWYNSPMVFTNQDDRTTITENPSVDTTCHCVSMLIAADRTLSSSSIVQRGIRFILDEQQDDGSWLASWGVAYIFGTWCALTTLTHAGLPKDHPSILRGVQWLRSIQNNDGGWGETPASYKTNYKVHMKTKSTASQTAWAVLGLMAANEFDTSEVRQGIAYLLRNQNPTGQWDEDEYLGTVQLNYSYVKYHGYSKYFPVMALARYRNLTRNFPNSRNFLI